MVDQEVFAFGKREEYVLYVLPHFGQSAQNPLWLQGERKAFLQGYVPHHHKLGCLGNNDVVSTCLLTT